MIKKKHKNSLNKPVFAILSNKYNNKMNRSYNNSPSGGEIRSNSTERNRILVNDKSKAEYLEYIKKLNTVKKENQDIKDELKKLNRSLDHVLKGRKKPNDFIQLNPLIETEEEINRKIESTEQLISKYQKDLQNLRENNSSADHDEKISLSIEIASLQNQFRDLEAENARLQKITSKQIPGDILFKHEGKGLEKEILKLRDQQKQLQAIIIEDEKTIEEKNNKLKEFEGLKLTKSSIKPNKATEGETDYEKEIAALELKISEMEKNKKNDEEM